MKDHMQEMNDVASVLVKFRQPESKNEPLARILRETPWEDIVNAVIGIEIVLGLLLEETDRDFLYWEAEAEAAGFYDEYAISDAELAAMPDQLRRGYVAQLIRNAALDLGISTEYSGTIGARRGGRDSVIELLYKLVAAVTPANAGAVAQ